VNELVATAIITALGTVLVAFITTRVTMKRNRDDVKLSRIRDLEQRLDKVEKEVDTERRMRRVLEDYADTLRQHITDEVGPPPPGWPSFGK